MIQCEQFNKRCHNINICLLCSGDKVILIGKYLPTEYTNITEGQMAKDVVNIMKYLPFTVADQG